MATAPKKTRTALTLDQRKAKLEKDRLKFAQEEAKIAIEETQSFLAAFKPSSVAKLFSEVRAVRKDVKDIDILRTLAKIGNVKVVITAKVAVPRTKKADKIAAAKSPNKAK
jgi:hypothetical protein